MAVENILALSKTNDLFPFFHMNEGEVVKDLMQMTKDHPLIAHDAISALVNLSSQEAFLEYMNEELFIYNLILTIILPKSLLADLCCMLLNNLTKSARIAEKLVPDEDTDTTPAASTPTDAAAATDKPKPTAKRTQYLDNLLEVFVRGSTRQYNPQAAFHFLSGVFANISVAAKGARCLRSRSNVDGVIRLAKIIPFTEHPDAIRRGGVVATIKNCCFDVEDPVVSGGLLLSDELNLLPYILLPLCGNEDFDDDEMEGMPSELQFPESTKKRESDPKIRLMLVECLVLLTHSRPGRDHLRLKRAYPVIKRLHPWEKDSDVKDRCERLVNMLARDEQDGSGGVIPIGPKRRPKDYSDDAESSKPAAADVKKVENDLAEAVKTLDISKTAPAAEVSDAKKTEEAEEDAGAIDALV
ncbi:hypothetical protein HDU96_007136 [Phlyctochytrium bullatum]|nr:hypothetical protein HDU96_007136 [Phlyctochytrium bullatum]